MNLNQYVQRCPAQGKCLSPQQIVLACCPGPGTTATTTSSMVKSPPSRPSVWN
jgi:hypothetical protein